MKKNTSKGFVLVETLIVTTFVAGVLIFLFIQFTNLSSVYIDSYSYNTVEDLFKLRNIKDYIENDLEANEVIKSNVNSNKVLNITNCNIFKEKEYCQKLFELSDIKQILVVTNNFDKVLFNNYNEGLKKFVNKINSEGLQKYRLLAEFNNSTYATIRFGEEDE